MLLLLQELVFERHAGSVARHSLLSPVMGELATTKMLRSFGSHAKSNFDRTLSCGFDMESDPMRTTKKLSCQEISSTNRRAASSRSSAMKRLDDPRSVTSAAVLHFYHQSAAFTLILLVVFKVRYSFSL